MRNLIYFTIIIQFSLIIGCKTAKEVSLPTMETVSYVDLNRFMGDWYVIANIPTFIEKNATNAIESYSLNEKGQVSTEFTFFQDSPNGEKKIYKPIGYIHNTETNAEWRMQFIWPFKMPFYIIDLDKEYSYTVIGIPSRKYVWIMARESVLADEIYDKIINNLSMIGYETSKIEKVIQEW